jgi:GWxTD domain-containing protein
MLRATFALLAAIGLAPVLAAQTPQEASAQAGAAPRDLTIGLVRFYRPDGNRTMVKAFVEVPYALLQPTPTAFSYRVTMKVTDPTGLTLATQSWTTPVSAAAAAIPGASGLEIAEFPTSPGKYRLEVSVVDSTSGRRAQASADIQAFAQMPDASDLLLSPMMRQATPADTVPAATELRRGNTMFVPVAQLRLQPVPNRSTANYLLEVYNGDQQESSASIAAAVVDTAGKAILPWTPDQSVRVAAGGGVLKGRLDLEGLPTGNYRLNIRVNASGHTIQRSAPFAMGELQVALMRDTAQRRINMVSDSGYFNAKSVSGLDSAFAPLLYVARSGELKPWSKDLTTQGKRNFLIQFWQKRDPTPGTERNEARDEFYGKIDFANREYRDPTRAGISGWRTDRGRIYAKYGAPDDAMQRPQAGRAPGYIAWRFQRGRMQYYVFADRTGLGNYSLVTTNDRSENSLPNWRDILTVPAIRDISEFLGIDLMADQNAIGIDR